MLRVVACVVLVVVVGVSSANGTCVHGCPEGSELVRMPNLTWTSNGCGSYGIQVSLPRFHPCCVNHDFCYSSCAADKHQCDVTFKKCLKQYYTSVHGLGGFWYYLVATTMGELVEALGCPAFLVAQAKSCVCAPTTGQPGA